MKARLLRQIKGESVTELYKNFVLDMISMLERSRTTFIIAYSPKTALRRFEKWLGIEHMYLPQRGRGMGQMLKNVFTDAYSKGFKSVIAMASDCPDLPEEVLKEALIALQDHDTVIGPSPDGGYYLIGFTQEAFSPKTFKAVTWSTSRVFKETISKLKDQRRKIHILPEWRDVDTVADLENLFERNRNSKFKTSKTMKMLRAQSKTWFCREVEK